MNPVAAYATSAQSTKSESFPSVGMLLYGPTIVGATIGLSARNRIAGVLIGGLIGAGVTVAILGYIAHDLNTGKSGLFQGGIFAAGGG